MAKRDELVKDLVQGTTENESTAHNNTEKESGIKEKVQNIIKESKELVEIELFCDNDKYKGDVSVAVNGKVWLIQRGKKVQVPRYVAEVLQNSSIQDKMAADLIREQEAKL